MRKLIFIILSILFSHILCAKVFIEIHTLDSVAIFDAENIDSISLIEPAPTFVKDINKKKYTVGHLGNNYWMLEDLDCAIFDTLSIHREKSLYTSNDSTLAPYNKGIHYNWTAANGLLDSPHIITTTRNQGICPNKFHIPNKAEWDNLFASIEHKGSTPLRSQNWEVTSDGLKRQGESTEKGFNSSASGYAKGSQIKDSDILSSYWSSESLSETSALATRLDATGSLSFSSENKELGKSVRCVWDGQTDRDWLYVCQKDVQDEEKKVLRYKVERIKLIIIKDDISSGTITDTENHTYRTKRYGSTSWMIEDLVSSLSIQGVDCNTTQKTNNYFSKDVINNICPQGWRLTKQEDYKKLEKNDIDNTFVRDFKSAIYKDDKIFSVGAEALYWVEDFTTGSYEENGETKFYIKGIPYFENYNGYSSRFSFVEISNTIPLMPCRCVQDLTEPKLKCRKTKKSDTTNIGIWQTKDYPTIKFTQNNNAENVMYIENADSNVYYDKFSVEIK